MGEILAMASQELHGLFCQWAAADPKNAEWSAAARDFIALRSSAPTNLHALRQHITPHGEALVDLVRELEHVCCQSILPQLLTTRQALALLVYCWPAH